MTSEREGHGGEAREDDAPSVASHGVIPPRWRRAGGQAAWVGLEGLVVPAVLGMVAAVAVWGLIREPYPPPSVYSRVRLPVMRAAGLDAAKLGVMCMWALHGAAQLLVRWRAGRFTPLRVARWLNLYTSPLALAPLIIALASPGIEAKRPVLTYGLIALAAAVCVPWCSRVGPHLSGAARRVLDSMGRGRRSAFWLGLVLVLGLWVLYGVWFSRLAVHHHHTFRTYAFDLGIYDNLFFRSSMGEWLACSLIKGDYHGTAHFDPLIVALSPLYALRPGAETILILQAWWIGGCVLPLYLLAWHRCKSAWVGLALALCAVCYPAMQGATMYEFHSLSLLGMPLCWLMYLLAREAKWRYLLAMLVCLSVREDAALLLCFVGAAAVLSRRATHRRLGVVTIVASVLYFVWVKHTFMFSADVIMDKEDAYSFAYYYRAFIPKDESLSALVVSLVTNPGHALAVSFQEAKGIYLLGLLVPLLFIPLLAGIWRVTLLYGAAFLLLASREPVFSLSFQYSTVVYPLLFCLVPEGLLRLRARRGPQCWGARGDGLVCGVLGAMLLASVLCCWKFGGVARNEVFRGGFGRVLHDWSSARARRYEDFKRLATQIPEDAAVTATKRLVPHVSARRSIYLPSQRKPSDFELVEVDKLKSGRLRRHERRVQRGELLEVGRSLDIVLYRVIHDVRARKRLPAVKPVTGVKPRPSVSPPVRPATNLPGQGPRPRPRDLSGVLLGQPAGSAGSAGPAGTAAAGAVDAPAAQTSSAGLPRQPPAPPR